MTEKPAYLSDEQFMEYTECFNLYDTQNHGFISMYELAKMFRIFGQNPTESELHDMIRKFDKSGKEQIGLIEFCEMVNLIGPLMSNDLKEAFVVFDRSGNGFISKEDFQSSLRNLGSTFTTDYINEMFTEINKAQNGQISMDEFLATMR